MTKRSNNWKNERVIIYFFENNSNIIVSQKVHKTQKLNMLMVNI